MQISKSWLSSRLLFSFSPWHITHHISVSCFQCLRVPSVMATFSIITALSLWKSPFHTVYIAFQFCCLFMNPTQFQIRFRLWDSITIGRVFRAYRNWCCLYRAAVCNRADICRLLISRGAKLQFRDIAGMTPLHYAIDRNHQECAEVLQMLSSKEVPITDAIFKFSKFHTKSHCAVGVMFTIKEKKREIPLIKEIRLSKKLIPLQKNGGCVCSEISGLSLALETGRY